MIFAYRSVELVIAFMGTLAAGVTIIVLDPAYPPARQKVHLQQPKKAPLICECKTLLRDQNEESTLVSYIVTDYQEWIQWLADHGLTNNEEEGTRIGPVVVYHKRFGPMQVEVRGHLKSKLPAYGVPSYCLFLNSMPSNPNGKDAALISEEASEEDLKSWEGLSSTNKDVAEQWVTLVRGLNAKTLRLESDFFESGGHGLLAQQLLLNIRQKMGTSVSINSLYSNSSLKALSAQVDRLRERKDDTGAAEEGDPAYAQSLDELLGSLDAKYRTADPATLTPERKTTVFMASATCFLGSYIVKDLLERKNVEVLAHVRGTRDVQGALERLKMSLRYGVWQDSWAVRLSAVIGDLS
ncbi:L-2-aminoadipate reductase large subunit [Metarhizium anisopliae]|nr:L-2-aminoadipate reductase large subunit [Metarhizium anisopliae]